MSVYSWVFGGMTPLGSVLIGGLSEIVGAHLSVTISGLIGILAVIVVVRQFRGKAKAV